MKSRSHHDDLEIVVDQRKDILSFIRFSLKTQFQTDFAPDEL